MAQHTSAASSRAERAGLTEQHEGDATGTDDAGGSQHGCGGHRRVVRGQEPGASLSPHEGRTVGTVARPCAFASRLVNEENGSGAPCPYCVCPPARRTAALSGNVPTEPRPVEGLRAASRPPQLDRPRLEHRLPPTGRTSRWRENPRPPREKGIDVQRRPSAGSGGAPAATSAPI
jgi:hypothetical protein